MLNTGIKFFIIVLGFLWIPTASLSLPNCPSDQTERYHNCFGTYTNADGDTYVGEFKDNRAHGQGTFTYTNGGKYIGEWRDDKNHGQGTYTYSNGVEEGGYHMNDEYVPTICENMGLREGSDPFGQCVIELITEINNED